MSGLINNESPHVLNDWIDKRGEALVAEQPSGARAGTVGVGNELQIERGKRG